jgi:hypothetical protein
MVGGVVAHEGGLFMMNRRTFLQTAIGVAVGSELSSVVFV